VERDSVSAWVSRQIVHVKRNARRKSFVSPVHVRRNRSLRSELSRWGNGLYSLKSLTMELYLIAF